MIVSDYCSCCLSSPHSYSTRYGNNQRETATVTSAHSRLPSARHITYTRPPLVNNNISSSFLRIFSTSSTPSVYLSNHSTSSAHTTNNTAQSAPTLKGDRCSFSPDLRQPRPTNTLRTVPTVKTDRQADDRPTLHICPSCTSALNNPSACRLHSLLSLWLLHLSLNR